MPQCPELNEPAFVSGGQHLVNKAFPLDPYAHELSRPLEQQQLLLDGTRRSGVRDLPKRHFRKETVARIPA